MLSHLLQKKFFILGAARSGVSAARLLKKNKCDVFLSELKLIPDEIKSILNSENIPFEEGGHSLQKLHEFDILVLSPGIPLSCEIVIRAKEYGLTVISEIQLALNFEPMTKMSGDKARVAPCTLRRRRYSCDAKLKPRGALATDAATQSHDIFVIGITGTNGKSTTTHYLAHLLNAADIKTYACGNIGTPLSEIIHTHSDYKALSIELSSYQLEVGVPKQFHASILLNLQNDHLARHKTFENYLRAKWNLILATRDDGIAIVDSAVFKMAQEFQFEQPKCKVILLNDESLTAIKIKNPCLIGIHNAKNLFAASMIAQHLGVSENTIHAEWEKSTSQYTPLAHRLENTPTKTNKQFINDSKATNVESTLVALKALPKSLHLLLGGVPKGDSYLPISKFLGKNIVRIYPFGTAASQICEELSEFQEFLETPSRGMLEAAQKAFVKSQTGEIILLSPACSSFDEFNHFEHRGDVFKHWVTTLEATINDTERD